MPFGFERAGYKSLPTRPQQEVKKVERPTFQEERSREAASRGQQAFEEESAQIDSSTWDQWAKSGFASALEKLSDSIPQIPKEEARKILESLRKIMSPDEATDLRKEEIMYKLSAANQIGLKKGDIDKYVAKKREETAQKTADARRLIQNL
ncbi:hypothetical protein KKC32_00390 [Patescibacteria group bacterium]|nr:hypothetical protein [Patescibacteria group bacterium]